MPVTQQYHTQWAASEYAWRVYLLLAKKTLRRASPSNLIFFSVCYIPIAGLPTVRVARTKDTNRGTKTQHMSHALTSLNMPLGPITWCLIAWDPMA